MPGKIVNPDGTEPTSDPVTLLKRVVPVELLTVIDVPIITKSESNPLPVKSLSVSEESSVMVNAPRPDALTRLSNE